MVRRGRRKAVDATQAARYLRVARALRRSGEDLSALAEESDRYGNAIAIVAIHAAIAYADALSVAYGGFKSAEGDHERAVDALQDALGARVDAGQVKALLAILKRKDAVSYQGVYFTTAEAAALVERLRGFADWAEEMYEGRP